MKTLKTKWYFLYFIIQASILSAQFTPGNLVLLQAGDGVTTLTNTGNPLILKEFSTSGSATFSVAIPSTSTNAMVLRGNATSEGYLSRSADGNYIVFGAYMQSLPNTSVLNSSAASSISRGIGLVDANGNFVLGASSNVSNIASGDIRCAAATNSANLWASSSSQGASYYGNSATATNVENTKTNLRAIHVFNNQLYISSQVASGTPTDIGVYAVGTGTPNSSAQTVSTVINAGTGAQPGQFYFNTAGTICYVADARTNSNGGGVQKWVQNSGTWSLAYTLPTGTANIGAFGVVADFSGQIPKVYATTTETSANRLVAIIDAGASSTATNLAVASTSNTIFRGLAWSPGSSTCVPVSVVTTSNNAPVCSADQLVLNVNAAGTSPINYTWTGIGVFSSTSVANPSITNSASGLYTVLLSNACGSASANINVSINPTPTIQVNAASICAGGVATITATGADNYVWNTNSTAASFTASPTSNTNYTVNGSSNAGCAANTATTSITIVSAPSVSVNSPSICLGQSGTITAQGASTYTWSNSNFSTAVIVVSPTITTSYTVNANASGCPNTVSTVATVVVNNLPTVSITTSQKQICLQQNSLSLTGSPTGGLFSGAFVNGSVFSPTVVGSYSITYSYTNSSNCSNSKTEVFVVSNCVGLNNTELQNNTQVFPNPVKNQLNIHLSNTTSHSAQLMDELGRIMLLIELKSELNSIDVSHLAPGMYYLYFKDEHRAPIKIVKE